MDQPDPGASLLRCLELLAMKAVRRKERSLLGFGNDAHCAVALAQWPVFQAVKAHLEPHELRGADLAHDLVGARYFVLTHQGADFLLGPFDTLRLALDDPLPRLRGVRIGHEQE